MAEQEIIGEILIIVFAVSISIWFHNWSESWKDQRATASVEDYTRGIYKCQLILREIDRALH